jgi:ATP-dependent protease Clp ATPase subunit
VDEGSARTRHPDLACSFCGRAQDDVRKLIAGPGAYICDACVAQAQGVVTSGISAGTELGQINAVPEQDGLARCTFCGKRRVQVPGLAALAAGSGGESPGSVTICAECLTLCEEIIEEELG